MADDYVLKPTVIAGSKLKDDYCAYHNGHSFGRIIRHVAEGSDGRWYWHFHPDERGAAGVVQMNGWTESRQESAEELKETYLLWRKRVGA